MKKQIFLVLIFIFIILPIILFGIVLADAYLTVTGFDVNQVSVNMSTPTVSLSPDNTSLEFTTQLTITLPQAGFIPKGVSIYLQLTQGGNKLGDPSKVTISLGETTVNNITQSVPLNQDVTDSLNANTSVEVTLKSSAKISYFGFEIPYAIDFQDQNFSIP